MHPLASLMLLALACATPEPPPPAEEPAVTHDAARAVAVQFVEALIAERYDDAAAALAPVIARRTTAADLEARMTSMRRAHGAPGPLSEVEVGEQYGMAVITGVIPFAQRPVDVKVVIDDAGRVDDYFLSIR